MELEQRFADDEACRQYLFGLRWPQGFECSACGGRGVWKGSRNRLLCTSCRRQIYILAGTVFQDSHLPLISLSIWSGGSRTRRAISSNVSSRGSTASSCRTDELSLE